jgi:hypothetical protein
MAWRSTNKSQGRAFPNKLANHMPPKRKEALGVLDLERFARALRLRWLWFK